jgi:hypothetical protein
MRVARRSTCGNIVLTRCCVYQDYFAEVGTCRITTVESCDAIDDRLSEGDGGADDEGPGSCAPNPCVE